ncbi:hypothetical protein ACA910_005556 [Epithemia clementina (nom. ined.)]
MRVLVGWLLLSIGGPQSSVAQSAANNITITNNSEMNDVYLSNINNDDVNNTKIWRFEDLLPCRLTSLEIYNLLSTENIDPCILYDIGSNFTTYNRTENDDANNHTYSSSNETSTFSSSSSLPPLPFHTFDLIVTNIMVTSSNCRDHRDGAVVGIEKLNAANDGQGLAIGFHHDHWVGFRLISIVAGNPSYLGNDAYVALHQQLLNATLHATNTNTNTTASSRMRYIIGTCSNYADVEAPLALEHETILTAQVGPPKYYANHNPWIFGFHVNSDDYAAASIRKLQFWAQSQPGGVAQQPVRVIYRTESEFFYSTCASAIRLLQEAGFVDLVSVLYDPFGDDDDDTIENYRDYHTMTKIADEICPPNQTNNNGVVFRPALFLCTLTEQEFLLPRFRENGCLVSSLWMTPATWTWASEHQDQVLHFQGAGQWHAALQYSDEFFPSGMAMLEYNLPRVGYLGGYDMLVSYAIPVFYATYLHTTYRVYNHPNPLQDMATPEGREQLRRLLLNIRANTIFGTVQFDDNQRNNGREAAAIQWQPRLVHGNGTTTIVLESALFSPDSQAQTELVLPAATASNCPAGQFVNVSHSRSSTHLALLEGVCWSCPPETFESSPGQSLECTPCPPGTTTDGACGSLNCTKHDDNLLSNGMLSFGYVALAISWLMALVFFVWVLVHRRDPVVRLAQIPFLLLICVGGIVSSSSIVGLTFQAGTNDDDDTHQASAGCMAAPILYSLGWIIQYGSLCAKTLRLSMIVENSTAGRRVKFSVWSSSYVVVIPLVLDSGILTAWSLWNPLEYKREETGQNYANGVVTIESIGRCRPSNDTVDVWAFLGPLFAIHLILVLVTHWLLWKVRNVSNRYQENKYLSMAAIFALEVAIVGIPILVAAQDSVEATFFVITGIVALDNIGVLAFIFIPKVFFQIKGLEEGVSLGESILSVTHKKAVLRESSRRASGTSSKSLKHEDENDDGDSKDSSEQAQSSLIDQYHHQQQNERSLYNIGGNTNQQLLPSIAENSEEYCEGSEFESPQHNVEQGWNNTMVTEPLSLLPTAAGWEGELSSIAEEDSEEYTLASLSDAKIGHPSSINTSDEIKTDPSTQDDADEEMPTTTRTTIASSQNSSSSREAFPSKKPSQGFMGPPATDFTSL